MSRGVVIAAVVVMLVQWLALGAWAVSWLTSDGGGEHSMPPLGHDLRVYWTVSWLTTHLGAMSAFHPETLDAAQLQFFPAYTELGHWLYPPTFQWLIQPLSWLPYSWTYAIYVTVSVVLFALAVMQWRRWAGWPWLVVMAFPGLWVAVLVGQNSIMTLLLMTVALSQSGARPLLAGVCAGLLVIKPQFAVLLPLWWLCGKQWRALGAMVLTGGVCCVLTLLWGGWALWEAFFAAVATFNAEVVQQGAGDIWHAMPTVFAMARLQGATLPAAYVLYGLVAVPSVLFTAWLWVRQAPLPLRVAAAVIATLLVQPYLLYYELAWLIVPLLCLATSIDPAPSGSRHPAASRRPWGWLENLLLIVAWALPLQAYLAVLWTPMGQWGVWILPALMLLIVVRACRWTHPRLT
ncbi:glycosyltransferase family 87 protein [Pandoraea aquatica]|nr:glycosyltransferase family 87 protein [Pandoraea aquatica]